MHVTEMEELRRSGLRADHLYGPHIARVWDGDELLSITNLNGINEVSLLARLRCWEWAEQGYRVIVGSE